MTNEEKILAMLENLQTDMSGMKTDISSLKTDVSTLKTDVEKIKLDVSGIKIRLDVDVEKKFQLLAEGHQTLLDTLSPKSRVEQLEDEMAFLKSIIKSMSRDIAELQKAQ